MITVKRNVVFYALCRVHLTGAYASALQQDFERRVLADMIDARCVAAIALQVATLNLATFLLKDIVYSQCRCLCAHF